MTPKFDRIELDRLLKEAKAKVDAMTPEAKPTQEL